MPVYEYTCAACGHVTEALRKMSEADAPIACESCGKPETRRSHSVFAAGRVRMDALTDAEEAEFSGILGHYHLQTNKLDPGPAFDWERFLGELAPRP